MSQECVIQFIWTTIPPKGEFIRFQPAGDLGCPLHHMIHTYLTDSVQTRKA